MKRVCLTFIALWVLLLNPGLCLAGVIEHLCVDCVPDTTCSHEENCAADPCATDLVQPPVAASGKSLPTVVLLQAALPDSIIAAVQGSPGFRTEESPPGINRPLPPSDLPYLS